MKWIKYSRYTGDDFGIGAEDLLRALSDYLLQSGFNAQACASASSTSIPSKS